MIVLPDTSRLLLQDGADSKSLLDQLESLKPACDSFLEDTACIWPSSESVHVVQGEFAELSLCGDVMTMGSTDATTCTIVVAIDLPTHRATICHHDEVTTSFHQNITQLVAGMKSPQLFLVGSYSGGNQTISSTSVHIILKTLNDLSTPITLKLFCALDWNTDSSGAPRCQSLAISLQSLKPFPVAPFYEGGWRGRGPIIYERMSQLWYNTAGKTPLKSIFDPIQDVWRSQLVAGEVSAYTRRILSKTLALPDEEFLQRMSTSPEHELPHVVEDLRKICRWVLEQDGPLRWEEREFQWVSNGWYEIK